MGIEDIPEMQVIDGLRKKGVMELSESPGSSGKFISLVGLNGKNYIYAENYTIPHETLAFKFEARAQDKYQCTEGLSPTGGGHFRIDEERMVFFDKSTDFGKYDEQVVRPIAERWRKQNLPNHELVFE